MLIFLAAGLLSPLDLPSLTLSTGNSVHSLGNLKHDWPAFVTWALKDLDDRQDRQRQMCTYHLSSLCPLGNQRNMGIAFRHQTLILRTGWPYLGHDKDKDNDNDKDKDFVTWALSIEHCGHQITVWPNLEHQLLSESSLLVEKERKVKCPVIWELT